MKVGILFTISVASAALIIQNVCVALSALAVFFTIYFEDEVTVMWDGWMQTMCHTIIIIFADIAGKRELKLEKI